MIGLNDTCSQRALVSKFAGIWCFGCVLFQEPWYQVASAVIVIDRYWIEK